MTLFQQRAQSAKLDELRRNADAYKTAQKALREAAVALIRAYHSETGNWPSLKEICTGVGASTTTAFRWLGEAKV